MYLNAIIRNISGGTNELIGDEELNPQGYVFTNDDYTDNKAVNTMFNNFKNQAVQRYLFDIEIYKGERI